MGFWLEIWVEDHLQAEGVWFSSVMTEILLEYNDRVLTELTGLAPFLARRNDNYYYIL